jgi:mono/diheme cytochrome c family protein
MDAFSAVGLIIALSLMLAGALSCTRGDSSQKDSPGAGAANPTVISGAAREEAESIYGERCAACHGDTGDGNGPGAANLNPRPVNFHNREWQRSIGDSQIAKAIIDGGQAVGLSASMAPNPDLEGKPGVVAALVQRIRNYGK